MNEIGDPPCEDRSEDHGGGHGEDQGDGDEVAALAAELRIALLRAARRLRGEPSGTDLSAGQFSVLAYLDRCGPTTPGALAEFERVRPPSLTRTLIGLGNLGLVERVAHPSDGRQVLIRLTEAGATQVAATRSRRDAWLARRVADLDPDERAALAAATDILRRIADS